MSSRQIAIYATLVLLLLILFSFFQLKAGAQSPPGTPSSPPSIEQVHRLTDQGKFDEALASLAEISKSNPAKNLSRDLGIVYYRKGDYSNAVTALQPALPDNPNDPES